ncbi:MAG: hypothetical protein FWD51_00455 [Betaproteobacteria bacterium]|nr:hypothetical protein [Betaproteobacteria bacterium]
MENKCFSKRKAIKATLLLAIASSVVISGAANAAKLTRTWWNTTVYFNKKETATMAASVGGVAAVAVAIPDPTVSKAVAASAGAAAAYAGVVSAQGKCMKFVYYAHAVNIWQPYWGSEAGGFCK